MKGWSCYKNNKESWRLGKMSSNPDIIVINKNHHNWVEIKNISSYYTLLSDHKLFELKVSFEKGIEPIWTNKRLIVDSKDRDR